MPADGKQENAKSRVSGLLDRALKLIALATVLLSVLGVIAACLERVATQPVGGYTYHRTVPADQTKKRRGEPGQTIFVFEVENPGPGELGHTHLEIDVPDQYDDKSDTFASDLVYVRGPKTEGNCRWNGSHATFKVMHAVGKDSTAMCPGDCFSIEFISPEYLWEPSRAMVYVEGKSPVSVLEKKPKPERSLILEWLVRLTVPALFAFGVVVVVLYFFRLHVEVERRVAAREADIESQTLIKYFRGLPLAQLYQESLSQVAESFRSSAVAHEGDQPGPDQLNEIVPGERPKLPPPDAASGPEDTSKQERQ